ncbi:MAG: FHA domain-containing protein [Verrucomicrobiia bacterium]|jgi:pSer/pThr/pTyr-binding forkhead associated (FHA) protein
MYRLVILSEGMTGRSYELKSEKTTVGRVEDNAFQIPEPSVSSHHCEIYLRGGEVYVKDLNSTNGTFIDGVQITESVLKAGQILRLGQVLLRLESDTPQEKPSKQSLSQTTMVVPQGVALEELEKGSGKPVKFESTTQFVKKSSKANLIFLVIGIILAIIVIFLLIQAFHRSGAITNGG